MFFSSYSAFGLDLSDLSVKLAWLKRSGQQLNLASFIRQDIPENIIESGIIKKEDELIDLIKKTVAQAKGEKIKTKFCVVSLPETESFIRVVQLPKIKEDEIAEAIKWELEANIPVSIEDVYFDWQKVEVDFSSPDHMDILIGALPKTLVDPYLNVIKKADLKPLVFEIESIATARALINRKGPVDPLFIIDIGAKRTSLIIFAGGTVLLTTSLPISNNLLIEDIAKGLQIDYLKAKKMKIKIGLDLFKEGGKVFRIIEPRLLELVGEIKKYIEYYNAILLSKYPQKTGITKILLCGGGANLNGLPGFLSSELKTEVAIGNPWNNILDPDTKELPGLPFSESLSFTTALGLALRGADF